MKEQLILRFPSINAYLKEDFYVSPSNSLAFNMINSWPKWLKRTLNVFGPAGSGKSHLMSIFENKTSCLKINSKNLNDDIFGQFKLKEALIIENVDEKVSETTLYSIFNNASQDNKYLIITSKKVLTSYNFVLPDLKSRVRGCQVAEIKLPGDDLINVILSKNFSDKQITVDKKHIEYIINRIDRSYEKVSKFISLLDDYSLKQGRPFSFKLIKQTLNMLKT